MPIIKATLLFWMVCCLELCLISRTVWGNPDGGVAYQVEIKGVQDDTLLEELTSVANTLILENRYPATLNGLRQRTQNDVDRFYKVLQSQGYYDAYVAYTIDEAHKPVLVRFNIQKRIQFKLNAITYHQPKTVHSPPITLPNAETLGVKIGEPVQAQKILDAKELIVKALAVQGYPYAIVAVPQVIADFKTHRLTINYSVTSGPVEYFGPVRIDGLRTVKEDFIRNKILWKEGDRFNAQKIKSLRANLSKTGLFSAVHISYPAAPENNPELPISIQVVEAKHHTVRFGISYKTDEGGGANVSWEHRNLLHRGEQFRIETSLSEIAREIHTTIQKPDFLAVDQSLLHNFRLARERTDAYASELLSSALLLERNIGYGRRFSVGSAFELSQIKQFNEKDAFALLSFPYHYEWDFSDDLFDPHHGGHFQLKLAPFINTINTHIRFLKGSIGYSHFFSLWESPSLVFATHLTIGAMAGVGRDDIPANIRFYAGGGGTIRGYAYQKVGPLSEGEPIGGRSTLVSNSELRFRVTENTGIVLFLDGGNVFENKFPDFHSPLQWGLGMGFRYFTLVGPLRVDFGIPVSHGGENDEHYQFYVSLGHAF